MLTACPLAALRYEMDPKKPGHCLGLEGLEQEIHAEYGLERLTELLPKLQLHLKDFSQCSSPLAAGMKSSLKESN